MALLVASEPILTVAQVRAANSCGCIGANSPASTVIEALIDQASDIIAIVTGSKIAGRQRVTARPCRLDTCAPCDCCDLDAIPLSEDLPGELVVKINGDTMDPSTYWLHPGRITWMLARISDDGLASRSWPSHQKRWRADTEDDTFSITWTQGVHIDQHIITAAGLEIVCDLASDGHLMDNLLDGVTNVQLGDASVTVDPNRLAEAGDTRLNRIANGELGPMTRRMMGILAPQGRSGSTVYAPELMQGWQMNLEIAA